MLKIFSSVSTHYGKCQLSPTLAPAISNSEITHYDLMCTGDFECDLYSIFHVNMTEQKMSKNP